MKNRVLRHILVVGILLAGWLMTRCPAQSPAPRPAHSIFDQSDATQPSPATEPVAPAQPATAPAPLPPAVIMDPPDAAAQAKAEKLIRELYAADYAKTTLADRQTLAEKLLQTGQQTVDDPVARFVLLREARDLATELATASQAIDAMSLDFAIDPSTMKEGVFNRLFTHATMPDEQRAIVRAAQPLANEAMYREDWPTLQRRVALVRSWVGAAQDAGVRNEFAPWLRAMQTICDEAAKIQPMLQKYATAPDDPAAAAAVGRFYCLVLGRWDKGLPSLVHETGDAALAAAAKEDLAAVHAASDALGDMWDNDDNNSTALAKAAKEDAAARDATAKIWAKCGNNWWDLAAATTSDLAKQHMRERAFTWYRRALPGTTGLTNQLIAKRLAEESAQGPVTVVKAQNREWTILFRSANPSIWNSDTNTGANMFAIPLAKAPQGVCYVKIALLRGDYMIVPITNNDLGNDNSIGKGKYGWNGDARFDHAAYHLGIVSKELKRPKGCCDIGPRGISGWGFGNRCGFDDRQCFGWAGTDLGPTVFVISVKTTPLTKDETRFLLDESVAPAPNNATVVPGNR